MSQAAPQSSVPPARLASGLAALAGAVLLLGIGWPVSRFAVMGGAAPLWLACGRTALSALATAAVLIALGRLRPPGRADLPAVMMLGLLQIAAYFTLSYAALAWIPAGRTALFSNATTLWVVPLSLVVLKEAIPPIRWFAVAVSLAGLVVMAGPWGTDWSSPPALVGTAFLLGAALVWATAIVVIRRSPPQRPVLDLMPWCFGLASLAMLPFAMLQPVGHWDGTNLAVLAALGLLAGPLGVWCTMQVQIRLPAVVASIGLMMGPVVGITLSALWLSEPLTPDLVVGALLIVGGAVVAAAGDRLTRSGVTPGSAGRRDGP
ncbi:DMT family transporter [Phreatobacter sp. AB_2022a]|uniref:DMT family transporter n=1 Tax=Phreatobacter sp. AB_2022a TaxID=3003134 RepID=UPI002287506E|nr:DMT family transporter [Phreatobacter sp. AB_2022a]MCZ0735641.1 DMT family transporter [Phreatobacter sp. AB_2022a]